MPPARGALLAALALGGWLSCDSNPTDALQQTIDALGHPRDRQAAVEQLVLAARRAKPPHAAAVIARVVGALSDAYRGDRDRPQIVEALIQLGDARAESVLIAAIRDAARGERYLTAAILAARGLGAIGSRGRAVAALLRALNTWQRHGRSRAQPSYARALIEALDRLRDPRAIPALIATARRPLDTTTYGVKRMAIRALGHARATAAIPTLIEALHGPRSGFQLTEAARVALCRIGRPAFGFLRSTARASSDPARRAQALRQLGTMGHALTAAELTANPTAGERLELARDALRRGSSVDAVAQMMKLVAATNAPLTLRLQAVDLLGRYGDAKSAALLAARLNADSVSWPPLLHARARRAVLNSADISLSPQIRGWEAAGILDAADRMRWRLVARCLRSLKCYAGALAHLNWRQAARAALTLGRRRYLPAIAPLLRRLRDTKRSAHPQLQAAIVTALEQLEPRSTALKATLARGLGRALQSAGHDTLPSVDSRMRCLSYRLDADTGGKSKER